MKKLNQGPLFFWILFFCFFPLSDYLFGQEVKIKTEDGIPVVYNPKNPAPPPGTPTKLVLEEDLTIGEKEKGSDYVFEAIRTIRTDDDGNIYVLDGKAATIKVFDKNGKYIKSIGRRGEGPGEFQSPGGMRIISGKEIIVSSIGRLSFFTLRGDFLRQITQMLWDPNPTADSKGNIIAITMSPGEKFVEEIKKFNPNLEPMFTITRIEREPPLPQKKRNVFQTSIFYAVLKDDSIVWGLNNQYQLMIVDKDGKLSRKIFKDYDPIKITEDHKQKFFEERRVLSTEEKERYEFPENYPAFYYISTDDEGRIFVWTYERDRDYSRYYDVFDLEGRYIAKITLKNNPLFWKKKKMYCVKEDMEGFHQVKRYKVTWK
jgi:hypothetical protein